jgi:hypothetical protein
MSELVIALEFVRTYLDGLLCITKASQDNHLEHLGLLLTRLQSKFCALETEYLEYILTRTGIKPLPSKVQAIFVISLPKQAKDIHRP